MKRPRICTGEPDLEGFGRANAEIFFGQMGAQVERRGRVCIALSVDDGDAENGPNPGGPDVYIFARARSWAGLVRAYERSEAASYQQHPKDAYRGMCSMERWQRREKQLRNERTTERRGE